MKKKSCAFLIKVFHDFYPFFKYDPLLTCVCFVLLVVLCVGVCVWGGCGGVCVGVCMYVCLCYIN